MTFFSARDLTASALEVFSASFKELNDKLKNISESKPIESTGSGVKALQKVQSIHPGDAIVDNYTPDMMYCAELIAGLSAKRGEERQDPHRRSFFFEELAKEIHKHKKKISVFKIVSVWKLSVNMARNRQLVEPLPEEGEEAHYLRHLQTARTYARALASAACERGRGPLATLSGREVASWGLCFVGTMLNAQTRASADRQYKALDEQKVKGVATHVSELFSSLIHGRLPTTTNELTSESVACSGIIPPGVPLSRSGIRAEATRKRCRVEVSAAEAVNTQDDNKQVELVIDTIAHRSRATQ